jgi:hypothetical protein
MSTLSFFTQTGPPISILDIEDLERRLKVKLPEPYRAFLLRYNGGVPKYNACDVFSSEGKYLYTFRVKCFLGVKRGKFDLERYFHIYQPYLPPSLIPIAVDQFQNIMAISTEVGRIYFLDFHQKISDHPSKARRIYYVAEDFDAFLEKLYAKKFQ